MGAPTLYQIGAEQDAERRDAKTRGQRLAEIVDALPETDVEEIFCAVIDSRSRKRIADAWLGGWTSGDMAMKLLTTQGLIECDEELLTHVEAVRDGR